MSEQMKITRFSDVPQMTRGANYRINVSWKYLEEWIETQSDVGIDLDPDFQRHHVWTEAQQTRYVEFVLRGGHSARDILWNATGWMNDFRGPFVLVDGKQRLEAVRKFMRDELRVFGSLLSEFTDPLRTTCADFVMHVNDLETRAEVLQWYLDHNSGGVVHSEDELERVRELLRKELATA